uniref:synaptotagmin-15-like isoform X2 n=1 Tax=Ciona intestinalis TaxID=7719 RepID=UPI000180C75C|nr:synaptotagmin-15-like isoform X2 [Ciona intestinalis]|eukprot:XP_002127842.1 synaptotagmin-15-like isoform X2 [Ciona intestinalis]
MLSLKRAFQQFREESMPGSTTDEKSVTTSVVVPETLITAPPSSPRKTTPIAISPVFTKKDKIIPFQLPPTIESFQVQSDIINGSPITRYPRSPTLSRVSFYQSNDRLSVDSWSQKPSPKGSLSSSNGDYLSNSPTCDVPRSPIEQSKNSFLGRIQPELYKYTENQDIDLPISRCGRMWFSVVYDAAVETLTVKVVKVKQLPLRHPSNNPPDSFVKIFLLPDERISQQTKVKLRNCNPTFNETFIFQVSEEELQKRSLRMSVYDVDKKRSTRHLLGHALVGLNDVDPIKVNEILWRDLDDIAHPGDSGTSLGELKILLTYLPRMNRLNVVVQEARNLRKMDLDATGIYVKVSLTQGHNVIKSKRTSTQDGAADPQYNESFSFKVTSKDMEQTCLLLNVITTGGRGTLHKMTSTLKNTVTRGRYGAELKYGRVSVGSFMYCRGEQLLHWQEMMAQPSKSIARWHTLSEVVTNQ